MIKYNSDIGEKIISNIKEASDILTNDIASKISSDFNDLTRVGLFSTQISNIQAAAKGLAESYSNFATTIAGGSDAWTEIVKQTEQIAQNFTEQVEAKTAATQGRRSGGGYSTSSSSSTKGNNNNKSGSSNNNSESQMENVNKGREVTLGEVKELILKMDEETIPILLKKINTMLDNGLTAKLLLDIEKSNIIAVILKRILGDTSEGSIPIDADTEEIRKLLLEKINKEGIDVTTEEGQRRIEEILREELGKDVDEEAWYKKLYGDNVKIVELNEDGEVGGKWVAANSTQDFKEYAEYVKDSKIYQASDPKLYGDRCLAFAEAHTYDLVYGTKSDIASASKYTHEGFKDFISDDKQAVLSKIYDEITSGRPVVLQVNGKTPVIDEETGEKKATVRHFVTVIGFKDGVVSGATLKETDLLILDSWDGKIERMDEPDSRILTSGKDCDKVYTGYRIRYLEPKEEE